MGLETQTSVKEDILLILEELRLGEREANLGSHKTFPNTFAQLGGIKRSTVDQQVSFPKKYICVSWNLTCPESGGDSHSGGCLDWISRRKLAKIETPGALGWLSQFKRLTSTQVMNSRFVSSSPVHQALC